MSASVARSAFTPHLTDTVMAAIPRSRTGDHVPAVAVALAEAGVTPVDALEGGDRRTLRARVQRVHAEVPAARETR